MKSLIRLLSGFAEVGREVWWVARCLPRLALLLLVATVGLWVAGHHVPAVGSGLGLGLLFAWPQLHWSSWLDVADLSTQRRHHDHWVRTCVAVGLSVPGPDAASGGPRRLVPRLRKNRCRDGVEIIRLRFASGQTLDDVDRAAPALAAAWGAHAVRVAPDGPSGALLTLALRNLLARPTATPMPTEVLAGHPLERVELGRALSGSRWTADARIHTLIAGMTGAGKGSVMWSLIVALAPAVHAGTVRLVGVDLKAGMELTHAPGLFSALATTPEQAVAVLEREADLLTKRADRMAGQARAHQPTAADPHVLVVVDELAALTAYISDAQLRRRADTALRVLLTQGRAPGWSVWGWVQDPRKDTVPMRNLFPQMVGLRLKDSFETEMVLGDAATKTAPCHRIDPRHPGTGFAVAEDGSVSKVRAHYANDDLIHAVNGAYPTVHRLPAVSLAPSPDPYGLLRGMPTNGTDAADTRGPAADSLEAKTRKPRKPRAPRESTRAGESA
ncbi:FtsK/SpoIIIE domain-containing protein [Intrasporangium sp. DVR]|uniref:FtsK/SpoIIIE domain-containing protein n=1 Tax=Intrasporangium sp. DVR TaxID=3127867 RepID=UPI00313A523B